MRILLLNCTAFSFKLHHETEVAEKVPAGMSRAHEHALVLFTAVEQGDSASTVSRAATDIHRIARRSNAKLLVINPFGHLSPTLADSSVAITLLDELAEKIRKTDPEISVVRSVFGWYKEFSMDVRGDRNSQLYREY